MRLPFGAVPAAGKKASASAAFRVVRFPVQPVKIDGQVENRLKILQRIAGDLLDFSQPVRQGVPVNVQFLHRGGGFSQMLDVDAKRGQKVGAVFPVIGGEGSGVGKLTRSLCDGVISIALKGKVNSLNASVACGIVVYEAVRQRQ